jgi:hypothetical protein
VFSSTAAGDSVAKHKRQREMVTTLMLFPFLSFTSSYDIYQQAEFICTPNIYKHLLKSWNDTM